MFILLAYFGLLTRTDGSYRRRCFARRITGTLTRNLGVQDFKLASDSDHLTRTAALSGRCVLGALATGAVSESIVRINTVNLNSEMATRKMRGRPQL